MKTLEELDISKTPWLAVHHGMQVRTMENSDVFEDPRDADINLISAAPELYQCLHEAVIAFCLDRSCSRHRNGEVCIHPDVGCPAYQWRAVLDKAAGESEAK